MSQNFYNKSFNLFSNCILVKGFSRSLIVDTQKNEIHFVPNDLFMVVNKCKNKLVIDVLSEFGLENKETIFEYFENLIKLELGFFCDENEIKLFPEMSLEYNSPFRISNAILEEKYKLDDYIKILPQLENLNCEYVELVFYSTIDFNELQSILKLFFYSKIKYIGLILKYDLSFSDDNLKKMTSTILRINKIIIHSSEEEKIFNSKDFNLVNIIFTSKIINSFNCCGNLSVNNFSINMSHFTESQLQNTCLNGKIAIDKNGEIRNCPAIKESFGNIKDISFENALKHLEFKKYWNINKDQIEVCKDCEFRHICTDCRAYLEEPENIYSKPLKCVYNPYTNEWAEWSTNPLKQKAIEYYGMQDLIKKDA